jgi:hypothetical protein
VTEKPQNKIGFACKAKPAEKIIISLPLKTKREQNVITLIYSSIPNRKAHWTLFHSQPKNILIACLSLSRNEGEG